LNKDKKYLSGQKIENYIIEKIIGQGRYGICYLVKDEYDEYYILKQLKKDMLKKIGYKVQHEEEILKILNHISIPKFIEKIETEKFTGYVLEYKNGKTFEELIFKENIKFERNEIYKIASKLMDVVIYLQKKDVVHRDIRVPNTVYDGINVYLLDFGLARKANNERYKKNVDFSFYGDFLLHLFYTTYEPKDNKKRSWFEELELYEVELKFLKRLMGIDESFCDIGEIEESFNDCKKHFY
jgi:serine/threonine protein kinase